MACPDCGSSAGDFRFVTSVETHGLDCGPYETFNEEFIVCRECGGRFDLGDWECTQEIAPLPRTICSDSSGCTEDSEALRPAPLLNHQFAS